jgi:hypothetical protein
VSPGRAKRRAPAASLAVSSSVSLVVFAFGTCTHSTSIVPLVKVASLENAGFTGAST